MIETCQGCGADSEIIRASVDIAIATVCLFALYLAGRWVVGRLR